MCIYIYIIERERFCNLLSHGLAAAASSAGLTPLKEPTNWPATSWGLPRPKDQTGTASDPRTKHRFSWGRPADDRNNWPQ